MNTLSTGRSTTRTLARTVARTTAAGVLAALALTACGTEQAPSQLKPRSVVQPKVQGLGSADALERRLGLSDFTMVGTPDSLERQLAEVSDTSCHTSADAAERAGADACGS